MIIRGKLIECKREKRKFDKRESEEKLWISLADAVITDEQMEKIQKAFDEAGKKFTPDWVKDFKGYVNVSTKYEVPFRDVEKVEYSDIEAAVRNGFKWMGAQVDLSISIKDGAIYPKAMVFRTEGSAVNAFSDFDEDEDAK